MAANERKPNDPKIYDPQVAPQAATPMVPLAAPAPTLAARETRRPMAIAGMQLPALSSSPDALSLLKALRRRWFLAGALGVLAAGMAGIVAYVLLPSKFTAFTLLQVSSKPSAFTERSVNRDDFVIVMKTTTARLKSRDVLMRTLGQDQVRHLHLIKKHPDTLSTLTWMEENLRIEIQDNSELLTVSLTGEEPNDLQTIVNHMVKSFMTIVGNEDKSRSKDRLDKTKLLYETAKEKLAEKVNTKDALLKSQGVKDPWAMMNLLQNMQTEQRQAQADFSRYRLELEKKTAQLANLKQTRKNTEKFTAQDILLKELSDFEPNLRKETEQLERLERQIEILVKEGHRPEEALRRQKQAELDQARILVENHTRRARAELVQKIRLRQEGDLDGMMANLQTEVGPLEKFVAETRDRIETLSKDLERINVSSKKYDLLDSEISQEQKNTDRLFDVFKQAQMEEDAEPRIKLIGEAELQNRDLKKRFFLLIASPLAAFFMVLLAVSWWEFAARRIHEPGEVVAGLALRVVGAVPELPDPKRRRANVPSLADEIFQHNLIESMDAIRTMLLRNAVTENVRIVMVTSAVSGEGKTTLASNLAMSLARAGRKTLLMDCDLRQPTAHQLFEQTLQPGFSEIMLHEVELPDALRQTTVDPNLFLLPAGQWDREVIQELAKSGITSIFEKLREEFDFIIVDSHPVLAATDSLLIGQHVDTVLVSLMRDVSQMHHVHVACQQFATLGIRVFGSVVNGVPVQTTGKGYQPAMASA